MEDFYNFFLLLLQIGTVFSLVLIALRLGKETICSLLPLLAVCMNLFVIKQISLFGLKVTCSESLVIGYVLGYNLLQEYYGKEVAKKITWITFFISSSFMLLTQIHLLFEPTLYDSSHQHFASLFAFLPRITISSIFCFLFVSFSDLTFFSYLRKKWEGKYLVGRLLLSLSFSQIIDTVLFSFLALYGIVEKISHVILFSIFIKLALLLFLTPFMTFAKRIIRRAPLSL